MVLTAQRGHGAFRQEIKGGMLLSVARSTLFKALLSIKDNITNMLVEDGYYFSFLIGPEFLQIGPLKRLY